jgi:hypothetical protein
MSFRRVLVSSVVLACAALASSGPAAAASASGVSVTVAPLRIGTELGRNVLVHATFRNNAPSASGSLIAHLNVLSLRSGVEVDPEDWSTHRTRYLGALPAGGSRTITWKVHAINTGKIALYVAVIPQAGLTARPATGRTVQLDVAGRRTLNSGGILPLALGIPALLGLMTGGIQAARRRR